MKVLKLLMSFLIGISASCYAEVINNSGFIEGAVPEGCEGIYQVFIDKITDKEKKERLKKMNMSHWNTTEKTFDLEFSKKGTYPVIVSYDLYNPTETLETRYQHYKQYHNKTAEGNDKMNEDRFHQKENEIKNLYLELQNNNSNKEYLILLGTLNTDTGESLTKERKIILIDPKYPDRNWTEITIDPFLQKRVALTLVSSEGNAMQFLNSNRDFVELAEKYNDTLISFILEPLPNNGKKSNPFFTYCVQ